MSLTANIIGAGLLGKTLGHLFVKHNLIQVGSICNLSEKSALSAIDFIGQGTSCSSIDELLPADLTFITTPDDVIATSCEQLSKTKNIKPGSIVLHSSGLLTSEVLDPLKEKGCYVASIHPMRSFATPELSIRQYKETYCAVEGDTEALAVLCPLFKAIGSIPYEIDKKKKSSYHAAGVFASNYLITLAEQALLCLKEAGVNEKMAMHVVTNLMSGSVSNLETTLSPIQSLTGPIKRGDTATIAQHMVSLTNIEQKKLYSILGYATLDLTHHDKTKKDDLKNTLTILNFS